MVTFRDRTNLYLSYRQSYPHHQAAQLGVGGFNGPSLTEEQQGLMDPVSFDQGEYGIEMDNLPPSWVDIADQVEEYLNEVDKMCTELDSYHRKNMLPGFDDRTKEEKQIEQMTFEITSNLHKCQALVKQLEGITRGITDAAELKMASNMKVALATKIQESSAQFRKMQSAYLKALRIDAFPSMDVQATSNPYGSDLQQEEDLDIASAQSTLQQSMLVETEDINIRQQEKEITKLAQGILEIADLFKDLQSMVIDQGTLLDRIDYNVETMYTNVQQADKELTKGSHYQKRSQKCKIILLLVLIVVALIIILAIKPKRHSNTTPAKEEIPNRPSRPPKEDQGENSGR